MYSRSNYGHEKSRGTVSTGPSTALAAVAFQDQLLRNLSLVDPALKRRKPLNNPTPSWKKNAKATIDTGLQRRPTVKKTESKEKEFVLDAKPPPPTLAQKLGLVDAPTGHLTEDDWVHVKANSNNRDDSKLPCVICKEEFGTDQQVLLSCSHVFHRACLEAFERFTGKKSCPLCRKEQYQKRVIYEGARHHRHVSATRIQATWRGFVVRKWYRNLRETVPPNDPLLRKMFYENKLKSITDRMVSSYDTDVNAFLRDIDRSLENSRQVFQHFDETVRAISDEEWSEIQLKAVERGDAECAICLNALSSGGGLTSCDAKVVHEQRSSECTKTSTSKKGPSTPSKIRPRQSASGDGIKSAVKRREMKKTVLLSCSHVFHLTCFEALEEFAVGERRFVCPVCRSNYQKRVL